MKKISTLLILILGLFYLTNAQTYSFNYNGTTRSYILHLPAGFNPANKYPLVLNFHGLTSNASQQQAISGMNAVSDRNNFIVVYPNGLNNSWNAGINNSNVDDVGFVNALIDTLIARRSVDVNRIYATGFSMGGYFSYRLGCQLSHRIVAIAPVSGLLATSNCNPTRDVPVLHIHGTNDGIVSYSGVASTLSRWRSLNACSSAATTTAYPNISTTDNSTVDLIQYQCPVGADVWHFRINNGGHTWPGGTFSYGTVNRDINASEEIWKFFSRYTLVPANPNPNVAPTVAITAPASNTSYVAPATVTIQANASDSDGAVVKVEFFNGTVKLGEDLTSPYSYTWNSVAAGSYQLTARATDNSGAVSTSSVVDIAVQPQVTTTCSAPSNLSVTNLTATSATLNWSAQAGASGYTVIYRRAIYFANWNVVRTDTNNVNITGLLEGRTYEFRVRATCPNGNTAYSAALRFTTPSNSGVSPALTGDSDENILVAPQPFTDNAILSVINGEKILSVKIMNMSGHEVLNLGPIENSEIEIGTNLQKGIFYVQIITESGSYLKKIVKQ